MKYIMSVTTDSQTIFSEEFEGDIPIMNRRKAMRRMKALIEDVKKEQTLDIAMEVLKETGLKLRDEIRGMAKEKILKEYYYTVCCEDVRNDILLILESSHVPEEKLEIARVLECDIYKDKGYNTGGEPMEVFVPVLNYNAFILADNLKENIGLRQLLDKE